MINKFIDKFYSDHDGVVLILSPANRFYLTGFSSSDGVVLITKNEAYVLVDFRYFEAAKENIKDAKVVLCETSLLKEAYKIAKIFNKRTLHLEDDYVTVSMNDRVSGIFSDFEIKYLGDTILKMRAVKSDAEIEKIKQSQEITDATFNHITDFLHLGLTENDVACEIDNYIKRCGAQLAFDTICVSGANSSLPHGVPTDKPLTENSFLTMDFGAKLSGYCSDMTRTVVLGKANDEMKEIYNIVLEAQLNALNTIKADVNGSTVDFAARNIIEKNGYGKSFGHSTGHSLGIDIHEDPRFSPGYEKMIPENAVLSVEPGIYLEGKFGVRIEDIVVVGKEKAINLTKSDKKLIEIH